MPWQFGDIEERKEDCFHDLDAALHRLLYYYGPVVLRSQIYRWLEKAPRNRAELESL